MSAVLKPSSGLSREMLELIDRISYEVRVEHEVRLDRCEEIPLRRRGRRVKKTPNIRLLLRLADRGAVENRGTGNLLKLLKRGDHGG